MTDANTGNIMSKERLAKVLKNLDPDEIIVYDEIVPGKFKVQIYKQAELDEHFEGQIVAIMTINDKTMVVDVRTVQEAVVAAYAMLWTRDFLYEDTTSSSEEAPEIGVLIWHEGAWESWESPDHQDAFEWYDTNPIINGDDNEPPTDLFDDTTGL